MITKQAFIEDEFGEIETIMKDDWWITEEKSFRSFLKGLDKSV